ncbi:hypothetical protein WI44_00180 [Burkholderia cepacia]|uniref:hypothetical protein n=1 Tax=Burkholderia cepacia TaxID=292 RepID=UPI00075730FA|nr:hypothetical protein [Burkholderia cepacia]KVA34391.1 hypothetical protein WI44_00180 [Burkholderia cepacia]KVA42837.1 hypothetical protein WI45_16575 [Burkholderia cepacia]
MTNDVWAARAETINKAAELIVMRHPAAEKAQVLRFVEAQFNAMATDPSASVTVNLLVQQYEDALTRQMTGDTRLMERIEKVLFKCMVKKPQHISVQLTELFGAYQTQTRESLRSYLTEVEAVLTSLEDREFISVKQTPGGQPNIFQGVDFDVWIRKMTKEEESKASVVHNYNVSGANARVNLHSTDNSTNTHITGDAANVQNEIANLRRAINDADLPEAERTEALEQVNDIEQQFASGKPKKSIVAALLNALPKVGSVASIASAIHAWLPK